MNPSIENGLATAGADLGESLAGEMAAAWAHGERLPAEHYLGGHPELNELPAAVARLIYEEVCLRSERGEEVAAEELTHRFPRWANELTVMLDCHRLVQARLAPPQFPSAGEALGDFQLLAELGHGMHGRVFLATQPTLADRLVILKITPREDREFLSLARLQHTHIIPLYGVHDFPARNLRALCQPYFGGATLARLLDRLRSLPAAQRTGRSLVEALDEIGRASPLPLPGRGPREALARASYPEAICWIGACLAEGLHYAHERGVVHLDLKPSNVLLAADGQPLLLDFHLALHPLAAGQTVPEGMGGTPEYMSPEQRAAFAAARNRLPVPAAVDHRSDVYSLGRLLYTALGGEGTSAGAELPSVRKGNPAVSVGLADIVQRCLSRDPAGRYADAAALAADLRRHLANLPLRGVANRSVRERWHKWRRRRPSAFLWTGLLLALLAAAGTLGTAALERYSDAQADLREGQEQLHRAQYDQAAQTLARGKGRAETLPGCRDLVNQFDESLGEARRGSAVQQLHAVTERLRLVMDTEAVPERDLRALEAQCGEAWELRHLVAEQARADLIDLALLWTDLRLRLAPGDETGRAKSRQVLQEAATLCGPSATLSHALRVSGGGGDPSSEPPARTFRDHAALGRTLLNRGDLDRAAAELEQAVDLAPQDFWAQFDRGICACRRGRYAEAVTAFTVAVALAPRSAEAYYNRAVAHAATGDTSAALHDYDRALELAPNLAAAALNRGVLHYQLGRYVEARADLERALRQGADPAAAHYNLALVYLAQGDRTAAQEHTARALKDTPTHSGALQLQERLQNGK